MFNIRYSINLRQFQKVVEHNVSNEILRRLTRRRALLEQRFKLLVAQAIRNSPAVQSMISGRLRGELGLVNPQSYIESIISFIVHNTTLSIERFSGGYRARIYSFIIDDKQWDALLAIPEASYTSTNSKGRETEVPWLEWMLLAGDKIVVREYYYREKDMGSWSRTNTGIMAKSKIRGWRVPEYSGTSHDNFITRAIDSVWPKIRAGLSMILRA